MAERRAEVLAVAGEVLHLRLEEGACTGCRDGCGGRCQLFAPSGGRDCSLPDPAPGRFLPGQPVRLVLDDDQLRVAAWRGYGLALAGLVLGAAAGHGLGLALGVATDLPALAGLVLGTLLAARASKRRWPDPSPTVTPMPLPPSESLECDRP